ncbi:MAG: multiple sugar transport system permease protein [Abditibacteriota bacterium]|nr:multiple sugar transport system permease protein [Abditibacteriota bacterium]
MGLLCLAPAVALLAIVFLYPIVSTLLDSVSHVSALAGRTGGPTAKNWQSILSDPAFLRGTLPRTLFWTIGVVSLTILCSLPAALLLQERFKGRKLARTLVLLPWAVPLPISAIIWKFIFNGQLGTLNGLLAQFGIAGPVWLAEAKTALPIMIWVGVWASIPFTTVTLLAGLQGIGADILEAASLDGANGWLRFRAIILPLLRPVLNVAIVLNTIYVFNSFPIIWVLTQGGPANSTDTIITSLYKQAFRFSQPGQAQAMGVVSFVVLLVFSAWYLRLAEKDTQ